MMTKTGVAEAKEMLAGTKVKRGGAKGANRNKYLCREKPN